MCVVCRINRAVSWLIIGLFSTLPITVVWYPWIVQQPWFMDSVAISNLSNRLCILKNRKINMGSFLSYVNIFSIEIWGGTYRCLAICTPVSVHIMGPLKFLLCNLCPYIAHIWVWSNFFECFLQLSKRWFVIRCVQRQDAGVQVQINVSLVNTSAEEGRV